MSLSSQGRLVALVALLFATTARAEEPLWTAKGLTPEKSFTSGIEGPNSDAAGIVYCVAYQNRGTIGRVSPEGKIEVFVELPQGKPDAKGKTKQSYGNGIVFDSKKQMDVADYSNHNVLKIDSATKQITVFAHDDRFNQPNDLAIGPGDVIWCSDPAWGKNTGQIFRVDTKGQIALAAEGLGTTNVIEVSPDGKTVFVTEVEKTRLVTFRSDKPGLNWQRRQTVGK